MNVPRAVERLDHLHTLMNDGLITPDEMYWILRYELTSQVSYVCRWCDDQIELDDNENWQHVGGRVSCDLGDGLCAYPNGTL